MSNLKLKRFIIAAAALGLVPAWAMPASAQNYPEQPHPPDRAAGVTRARGSSRSHRAHCRRGYDQAPRASPSSSRTSQGAQTAVGLELTARAKPDGYTMMWATSRRHGVLCRR